MNKRIFKRVAAVIMSVSLLSGNVLAVKAEELLNLDDSAGELAVESEESILLDDTGDAALKIEDEAVSVSETDNETVQPESLITQDDLAADTDDDDIVINGDSVESVVEEAEESAGSADIDLTDNANTWDGVTTEKSYEQGQISYVFTLKKTWRNGYNASVRIYNNGSEVVDNWALCMDYPIYITNIWNATIEDDSDGRYTIKNASWNADIKPGRSVEYGFSVKGDFTGFPESFSMLGIKSATDELRYTVEYFVDNEWKSGFTGRIVITNTSESSIEDWTLSFTYDREIRSIWSATIESHEGNRYVIKNKSYNANIKPGESVSFGFKGNEAFPEALPYDYVLESSQTILENLEKSDVDEDGLTDDEELQFGTDPNKADTDGDGLNDYVEVYILLTNPLDQDTDSNGINDGDEDFDDDTISNIIEMKYNTNPYSYDTDNDGFLDSYELDCGMNPLEYDSIEVDRTRASELRKYSENEIRILNIDEYYPLEIEYEDDGKYIKSISGVYSEICVKSPIDAIYALYNVADLLGLYTPEEQLKLTKFSHNESGDVYTFNQVYNDVEIIGNIVVVSVKRSGQVNSLFADIIPQSEVENLNTTNIVPISQIKGKFSDASIISIDLRLYDINSDNKFEYVYDVLVNKDFENIKNIRINAISGETISEYTYEITDTLIGSGTDDFGNVVLFPVKKTNSNLYILEDVNRKISIYDYTNSKRSVESQNAKFSDSIAVTAYSNVQRTYDWWKGEFNYIGLNGKGGETPVFIHYSKYKNNAFLRHEIGKDIIHEVIYLSDYNRQGILMAPSLATTAHEFTHAVFYHSTPAFAGDIKKTAMTINEAYSDIFASFVDSNTWRREPRNAVAPLLTDNPERVGGNNYDPTFSEEHKNATILTHAAFLMQSNGISFDKMYKLWYDSLFEGIGYRADFNTIRNCVLKSARKNNFTYDEINVIKEAFDEVGIYGDLGTIKVKIEDGNKPVKNAKVIVFGNNKERIINTDNNGEATFYLLDVGTNYLKVEKDGYSTINTQVLVKKNKTINKSIRILAAGSQFVWDEYDHYNYQQPYVATIPKHIITEGADIKMIGYTVEPIKDFLITKSISNPSSGFDQKYLSFDIVRDKNNWHTMEGGGFLFNSSVDKNNVLSGYCMIVTQRGLELYEIPSVDVNRFSDGKEGNLSNIGKLLCISKIGNVLDMHNIGMRITDNNISIWCDNSPLVENLNLGKKYGDEFGPITSHISHNCRQVSYFTFSNIQMSSIDEF